MKTSKKKFRRTGIPVFISWMCWIWTREKCCRALRSLWLCRVAVSRQEVGFWTIHRIEVIKTIAKFRNLLVGWLLSTVQLDWKQKPPEGNVQVSGSITPVQPRQCWYPDLQCLCVQPPKAQSLFPDVGYHDDWFSVWILQWLTSSAGTELTSRENLLFRYAKHQCKLFCRATYLANSKSL